MISRAARTLGPMRLPSSWPSCIVRDTRDILTLNGGSVFNVGIVHTVRLTSTGNSVSEYQDFPFPPMETIVGQVEKIGSLTRGMVLRSILAEI